MLQGGADQLRILEVKKIANQGSHVCKHLKIMTIFFGCHYLQFPRNPLRGTPKNQADASARGKRRSPTWWAIVAAEQAVHPVHPGGEHVPVAPKSVGGQRPSNQG